jgi:hypothetical protein
MAEAVSAVAENEPAETAEPEGAEAGTSAGQE